MTIYIGDADGTYEETPLLLVGWESTRESQNVLHTIVGSEVVETTLREAGLRSGEFTLLCDSYGMAQGIEYICSQAKELYLMDDEYPYISMDFVVSGSITVAVDEDSRTLWTVTIDFQEI